MGKGHGFLVGEIYLEIDIPSLPMEEPDQKIPPLGEVSTILITSPHKSPQKSEGSMTMEVSNLLSQAVLEAFNCESKCSSPRRSTTAVVLMTPPQKPEGLPQTVDTSSQASIEETEASVEDIPTNISSIATVSRSGSVSPSMNLAELQTNANRALDYLLNTKGSIDARRWRAVWELGGNTLPEWVSSGCIYQGSQSQLFSDDSQHLDSLFFIDPWGKDEFPSSSEESQDNQGLFGPRSQGCLFQSHLWGWSLEGLSGCDIP